MSDAILEQLENNLATAGRNERYEIIMAALKQARKSLSWADDQIEPLQQYAEEALQIAEDGEDAAFLAETLYHLMLLNKQFGKHSKSLGFAQRLLEMSDGSDVEIKNSWRRQALDVAATSCYYMGDLKDSLRYHQQQHEEASAEGSLHFVAGACNGMGFVMRSLRETDKSLQHFREAAEAARQVDADELLVVSLNEIGNAYYALNDYDSSLDYHLQALEIAKKLNSSYAKCFTCHDIGLLYVAKDDYAQGLEYMLLAQQFFPEGYNARDKALMLINTGFIYGHMNDNEKAVECNKEAERLAEESGAKEVLLTAKINLAGAYESVGDFEKAFRALQEHTDLIESIFNERHSREIAEMETRYEATSKQREAEIYRLRNVELVEANNRLQESLNKLEKAQQEIIDLERKTSALAMAVTANHEINQPLMVLRGNLEMYREAIGPAGDESPFLGRMESALDRISEILNKFREFSGARFAEYSSGTPMVVFDNEQKGDTDDE